jgi:ssDNA-binding Zn-finger/Zn-ribbon topoisomerase 1
VHLATINEVVAEVELPNESPQSPPSSEKKAESAKVECPDCGKSMSAKTLRYSHGPNCLFKKQADKEEADPSKMVTQEMIEAEVQKRMSCAKAERLNRRQKQIESLVASAF